MIFQAPKQITIAARQAAGVFLLLLGAAPAALANNTLIVDATLGSDNGISPFATIQAALAAAAPGDAILVEPGTYEGPVLINMSGIVLRAAAIPGPRPVIQVSAPTAALGTVQLAPGTNDFTIRGFEIIGIDGDPGLEKAALYLQGPHENVLVRGNTITAAGDAAILTEYGAAIANLTIDDNLLDGATFAGGATGGPGGGGQFVEPNWPRSLVYMGGGAPSHSGINFTNNTITAVTGDSNNSNTMVNIDAAGALVSGNSFGGSNGSRAGVPVLRVRGSDTVVSTNTFTAASHVAVQVGGGSIDTAATSAVTGNSFVAAYPYAVANLSASMLLATHNFWGGDGTVAASGPFPPNSGYWGSLAVSPWYADAARTALVEGFLTDATIAEDTTLSVQNATVTPGTTVTVRGALQVAGGFILQEGAVLEVINGDLALNGSTLSGSFTLFNSLGSIAFNADTSITGSAAGLILISDVHVAAGAVITIDGTLVVDGCSVASDGRFDWIVNPGARFTMARTEFAGGDIQVRADDTHIFDNRFSDTTLIVFPSAEGAAVYHNLTDNPAWLTDAGSGTLTTVDGWGNVTDPAATENNLLLDLGVGALSHRTRDADGNIYVQPGDAFTATAAVSALQAPIAGVELLLGYNSELLAAPALDLLADWDVPIVVYADTASVIGKLDSAIGLSFNYPDAGGSDSDQPVAGFLLAAGTAEGQTRFFQRVKLPDDSFGGDIRLTTGGLAPVYLIPFTGNSGLITIDGTDPLISTDPADIAILQDGIDMTLPGNLTLAGPLEVAFSAYDELSGLNEASVTVTLVQQGNPSNTLAGDLLAAGPSALPGYTAFLFEVLVAPSTLNGTYDVVALVRDRSGNEFSTTLGTVEIAKFQVAVAVQLQGLVPGPITRDVTFVLTDINGVVLETRTEPLVFTSGIGSTVLENVDGAAFRISAKTAWNLRRRLDLAFDAAGQAAVSFTGPSQLLGGDLDGSNTIGTFDFGILRFYFNQTGGASLQADITASGTVGTFDFGILRANFNTVGDPL